MDYILGWWQVLPDAGKVYAGIVFLAVLIIVVGLISFSVSHFRSVNRSRHRITEPSGHEIAPG